MKPIGKNIIIKTIEEEIKTSVLDEGDFIFYDKRSGYSMIINDEPFTIIQEKDVVVVL